MGNPFSPAKTINNPWRGMALGLWIRRWNEGIRKERKWSFPTRRERKAQKMLARREDDF